MDQKYKFFIMQNCVTFSQNADLANQVGQDSMPFVDKAWLSVWIKNFQNMRLDSDKFITVDALEPFIDELLKSFTVIKAAGGFVVNDEDQLLMIHRRGAWDLPKGKIEPGETPEKAAIREVGEECGIDQMRIDSGPFSTFHLYHENGEIIIKESIWFKIKTAFFGELKPQSEEDIDEAIWTSIPVSEEYRNDTYYSIHLVLDHFS
jgi:8-oxo-dGTP pyrophosphatase MutT (NUDIX family)